MNSPEKPIADGRGVEQRVVDQESAGQRLDNFLIGALKGIPRSHVYRLIRSGQVRVNSGRAAPSYRLEAGDRVRLPPVRGVKLPALGPARDGLGWLAARIVFEDARLVVIDKPAGLAVHGGSGVPYGCIEALRSLRPDLPSLELVHRLDQPTSGCLLLAKRRSVLRTLHALLRDGRIDKRYLGLLKGRLPEGRTVVDVPLTVRHAGGEARVSVAGDGKAAHTELKLLERYASLASFAEISIATGRTHQIRVHAAHLGHPLAGDDRYGDPAFNARLERFGLHRLFLHAHAVTFTWPDTGEPFSVSVPLAPELAKVLDAIAAPASPRAG